MSKFAKITIGTAVVVVFALIAVAFFLHHLVTKSFPVTSGAVKINGLHNPVAIYRDEYGIPHIDARDEHDAMVAVGYVHAQDRLWQMDMMRRAGEGRLSEVFDTATVRIDALFRTLGLRETAERLEQNMHPEARRILEDYSEGVNAFIASHMGTEPVEFDMLNYKPEPWTSVHSLLVLRLMAWDLTMAWTTDMAYGEMAARLPPEKLRELAPFVRDSLPAFPLPAPARKTTSGMHEILDAVRAYRAFFALGDAEAGSNAWVTDSSKSWSGKPLLANDPHLPLPAPSRWYELHISAPGWNVAGMSIPGVPLVAIGHNEHLAWGLTNAMLDDADFYVEKIDSARPDRYIFKNSSLPLTIREEKIFIGSSDSITITVRATRHGPLIDDVHPFGFHRARDSSAAGSPLALRWAGLDMSDEVYGFFLMDRATTRSEFEQGLKEIAVPGLAVVYGDVEGTIASWTAGRVPIRGKGNPAMPLPGWTGEAEWTGFVPFERLPAKLNPPEGFIVCANQNISDPSYPYYLSTLWAPLSRTSRIRELLRSTEKFTADDFKQFQQDVTSPHAREVTGLLLAAYQDTIVADRETSDAITYLRNWDYRFTQSDIATTLFNTFYVKLLHNIYEDELGPQVFDDFVFYGAIAYRVTSQLLAADSSAWFDDVNTPEHETKNEILRRSFSDAVRDLQLRFGSEMKTWQWGSLHTVTFRHPFGNRKPLDMIFNIGPFAIGGGGTTVNKTEFKFSSPFSVTNGPSMRTVIDLSTPDAAYTVITTGQSGQPLHRHYADQTPLWLNGGYRRVTMNWNQIRTGGLDRLELSPEVR